MLKKIFYAKIDFALKLCLNPVEEYANYRVKIWLILPYSTFVNQNLQPFHKKRKIFYF